MRTHIDMAEDTMALEWNSGILIVNDMDRKFGLWVSTLGYQSIPPRLSLSVERNILSPKLDF